ncbi:MAG TPA: 2-phospho-L-lactate transferase [Candidatus Dormibacteraeota bacterium]|nr:2-phospho-L-lactate transferase [Candidatus Dormibacteraeota bacterium]
MKVVQLAGGTGGAKLADGFQQVLPPGDLTVIINVGDDTEWHGLLVCPDIDTILYTLAGVVDIERGWGVADDTFAALAMLGRYGGETWFQIGDADLATHARRHGLMRDGASLTDATAIMASALGVPSHLVPATDDRLRTLVQTDAGWIDFQDYFVRRGQADDVRSLRFEGVDAARPSPAALEALAMAELVVIGPSNPLVSLGPTLAIPGMREAVVESPARRIGVSGIVAGQALRGPADRMLGSLGHESSAVGVARLYQGLLDRFVVDTADAALAPEIEVLGMEVSVLPTVMRSRADRAELARAIVALA